MLRLILISLVVMLMIPGVQAASNWTADPSTCPEQDQVNFAGQNCAPDQICGDSSGIAQCYDTSTINAPAGNLTSNTDWNSGFDGGYLLNCYATADAGAPFCDNSGNFWCDRNSTCYTTQKRDTSCQGGSFEVSICGNCRSGFVDCNADPLTCEVQSGSTACGAGANNNVNSTCGCVCDSGWLDCDAGGTNATNGCEIQNGASCTLGGLSGTQVGCTCVVDKSFFETGTFTQYNTNGSENATLWFKNFNGSSNLIEAETSLNISWKVNGTGCVMWLDGTATCTHPTGGSSSNWNYSTDSGSGVVEDNEVADFNGGNDISTASVSPNRIDFHLDSTLDYVSRINAVSDTNFILALLSTGEGKSMFNFLDRNNISILQIRDTDIIFNKSLIPSSDEDFNLGNSSARISEAYISDVYPANFVGYYSAACGAGEYVDDISDAGTFNCSTPIDTDTTIPDTNETTRVDAITGTDCGAGNYSYGFDASGNIQCRVDTGGSGGTGKTGISPLYNDTSNMYLNWTKMIANLSLTYHTQAHLNNSVSTFNVNGSDNWDNFGSANSTQFEDDGGVLSIITSWFDSFWDEIFASKDTDDLTEGSSNLYDNQSWNEGVTVGWDKDPADDFTDISNFTGTLTDGKICDYDSGTGLINCIYTDNDTVSTAGPGIIITGTEIAPDMANGTAEYIDEGQAAGGDLGGTYPNPTVDDFSHNHDGTNITTGTVADARLSSNVFLADGTVIMTGPLDLNGQGVTNDNANTCAPDSVVNARDGAHNLNCVETKWITRGSITIPNPNVANAINITGNLTLQSDLLMSGNNVYNSNGLIVAQLSGIAGGAGSVSFPSALSQGLAMAVGSSADGFFMFEDTKDGVFDVISSVRLDANTLGSSDNPFLFEVRDAGTTRFSINKTTGSTAIGSPSLTNYTLNVGGGIYATGFHTSSEYYGGDARKTITGVKNIGTLSNKNWGKIDHTTIEEISEKIPAKVPIFGNVTRDICGRGICNKITRSEVIGYEEKIIDVLELDKARAFLTRLGQQHEEAISELEDYETIQPRREFNNIYHNSDRTLYVYGDFWAAGNPQSDMAYIELLTGDKEPDYLHASPGMWKDNRVGPSLGGYTNSSYHFGFYVQPNEEYIINTTTTGTGIIGLKNWNEVEL